VASNLRADEQQELSLQFHKLLKAQAGVALSVDLLRYQRSAPARLVGLGR
jgi:lysylphosphatidylglycerol synthetase-like protein (DUF2156 family)